LKATYFGDLVLTTAKFQRLHDEAIAPIKKRWQPLLHVEVAVERELKAALATPGTWPVFRETSDRLARRAADMQSGRDGLRSDEVEIATSTVDLLLRQSAHLTSLADALEEGSIADARAKLDDPVVPFVKKRELAGFAARMRAVKHPISLSLAASLWEVTNYQALLKRLSETLSQNFFVVIGDAGFGKTYLAAELTKPSEKSPGGILCLAKYLSKGGSLDDVARRVPFGGERMEQLLEAVDAAGARSGRRLPIVIDGLNESENPRGWKDLLETLRVQLNRTSNCVVIVTLRSFIANDILPPDTSRVYLDGFEDDPETALRTYFEYYKIDATDALLPWSQLSSPLFLNLFCQATNPDRQRMVGLDRIPQSLTAVFEEYRQVVVSRAADALDMAQQDIEAALDRVGLALWRKNARALDFDILKKIVGDDPRAWQNSLARFLEEEGVLSRDPYPHFLGFDANGRPRGNQVSAILYDAFAGFVIADAILAQQGIGRFPKWISKNWQRLDVFASKHHPFAEDILNALVGLRPRRHYCQLWPSVPSPLREVALSEAITLEPTRIDGETRSQLFEVCKRKPADSRRDVFFRLRSIRASVQHPLNADFLHEVLSDMSVAQRDLRWSEWLRHNREMIHEDLESLELRWCRSNERGDRDKLLARWVSWTLTCTVRYLRDQATRSLYSYGLGAPGTLFEMAAGSLDINDPYVPERMLAAAYGVVMAQQRTPNQLAASLTEFLRNLAQRLSGDEATSPTYHWMSRLYVQGIVDFAKRFVPSAVPEGLVNSEGHVLFAPATYAVAASVTDQHTGHLGHDFENYEVGRLFDDRGNYDYDHKAFKAALTEIRGRVWALGYRQAAFEDIDSAIGDYYTHRNEPSTTERYAKKYGWIGFYEKAGVLPQAVRPKCGRGNPIPDIDPSFPRVPPRLATIIPDWIHTSLADNKHWLANGDVVVPDELLRLSKIGEHDGPWIAVDGFLTQTNKSMGRRIFAFIRGILVTTEEVDEIVALLTSQEYLGNNFISREPSDHYTFAGEIPWSDEFGCEYDYEEESRPYMRRIGGHGAKGRLTETLSHSYAWEDYHSATNRAGGSSVPSKSFSREFDLRGLPSSFDQVDLKGRLAATSLSPPENCDRSGNVLYLREDLLCKYASDRNASLVWAVWGERSLTNLGYAHPSWWQEICQRHGDLWRRIETHDSLSRKRRDA
jgi:hypothetical protein